MIKLSIVVPCYNEADNLTSLLGRFQSVVADRPGVEVVLVDNGSTDRTDQVLQQELSRPGHHFARSVRVPRNRGYGHGIITGLQAARGEYLAWTHADLQTDPADVMAAFDRLTSQIHPQNCLVRGRRVGRGWFDAFFTAGMSLVSSLALGVRLHDINAQPKLFHRRFLEQMTEPPEDFALDLYVLYLARRHGLTELEQPVSFGKRMAGVAKGGGSLHGKYRLTKRAFHYIFALRHKLRTSSTPPAEQQPRQAA